MHIRLLAHLLVLSTSLPGFRGAALAHPGPGDVPPSRTAQAVKVTVLSTMLADRGIGEWGYAALVEVDGRRLLFDTGNRPETVLQNARELGIDLSQVTEVVLSHNHKDHTGGLLTLRRELMGRNPAALSKVHVAPGIFWSRLSSAGVEQNPMVARKRDFEATGGVFVTHASPTEILPGVWFTGPVPRKHPERNWSIRAVGQVQTPTGPATDSIPEDASLIIDTPQGLVLVAGCGHAGLVNTLTYARSFLRAAPVHAAIGGFHLFQASEETLAWTAAHLREMGLAHLLAGHCTGIEATYRLRALTGLERRTAMVSAVGSSFSLGSGIDPLILARE